MSDEAVLARLEANLQSLSLSLLSLDKKIDRVIDVMVADHETRLRRVERWVWSVPPAVLVAGASLVLAVLR